MMVQLSVHQGWTVGSIEDAALMVHRCRLQLARGVDDRGGRVAVDGSRGVTHVAHHPRGRRTCPVASHVHAVFLLLLLIVCCIPDVHAVVWRKPWIGHSRLLSSRGAVVVPRHTALSQHAGVARVTGLLGLLLHRLLLRHLDRGAVVLLVLMRMLHPAIAQIRDIRICKIRTHAMAMCVWLLRPVTRALLV